MKMLFWFLGSMVFSLVGNAQTKIFEPGVISTDDVFGLTISPNGKTLLFVKSFGGRNRLELFTSQKINRKWQKPQPFFKNQRYKDIDPCFSIDGKEIYFNSIRPTSGNLSAKNFQIWKTTQTSSGWSEPQIVSSLQSDSSDAYMSFDKKGNIYFGSNRSGGFGKLDIWTASPTNNGFSAPKNLGNSINTSLVESNPCVSYNGDYLIFAGVFVNGQGDSDLYITFKDKNGEWSSPLSLGTDINTELAEFSPFISRDGKTFYFGRIKRGTPLIENMFVFPNFDKRVALLKAKYSSQTQSKK